MPTSRARQRLNAQIGKARQSEFDLRRPPHKLRPRKEHRRLLGRVASAQGAIRNRHHHHGYMADYGLARRLVQEAIAHRDPCIFASWF